MTLVRQNLTTGGLVERTKALDSLRASVAPLGFDELVRVRSDPGTALAIVEFRCSADVRKRLKMLSEFQATLMETKQRWRAENAISSWHGEVCDTPDAAFLVGELSDWGGKRQRVLNNWGNRLRMEYREYGGCSCHLGGAPCSACTHPGNPHNAEEDPEQWEWV